MRRAVSAMTLAALFGIYAVVRAQTEPQSQPAQFSITGDTLEVSKTVTTYRGNVAMRFPGGSTVLTADEVRCDRQTNECSVTGNVRLKLDRK